MGKVDENIKNAIKKWEVLLRRDVRGASATGEVVLRGTSIGPGASCFREMFVNYSDLQEIKRVINEFMEKTSIV